MPKRCHGCMKLKENSPVCEHCGYNEHVPNYPHQLPIGTVLKGQYTVGKVLGQGGFGITYIGWDNSLEAPVAIKEFYPGSFVNRDCSVTLNVTCNGEQAESLFAYNRERFLKEAKILAKLQNVPGIVRVQNLFTENNTAYIVMEYVKGIDLKHYIRMQGRVLTCQEAFSVLRPVMYALSRVHEAELVHRDISPDNIMILPDGSAKLLDFGAAREVENPEVDKELPQSTEAILKHGFAPMEQYRRRGSLGPWTDVYALCATMYYCLTGKVPNSAPERIMGDDNVNWRQIPGLTEQQIATLEKGLALMPENRLRTMEQLYRGLFPQREQTAAPRPAPKEPKRAPEQRKQVSPVVETKKKKKKPTALIAAGLAVIAAASLFFLKPGEKDITVEHPEVIPSVIEETTPAVLTPEQLAYLEAEELENTGEYGKAAIAFGKLGDFEDARERSFGLWNKVAHRETIANGEFGVRTDGTVAATGATHRETPAIYRDGEYSPEEYQWRDIVAITSRSIWATIGLKRDGTVETSYEGSYLGGWKDIVAIDGILGLKMDGTVVVAPDFDIQEIIDIVSQWRDIVAVCGGETYAGLHADGTVTAFVWEWDQGRQIARPLDLSHWTNITAIASAGDFVLGLRADGTVVCTDSSFDVSGWTDIVEVAAESYFLWESEEQHVVGLRSDGSVVATGSNRFQQCAVSDWTDIVAISTGKMSTIGQRSDGTIVATGYNAYGQCRDVVKWTDILLPSQSFVGVSVESSPVLPDEIPEPYEPVAETSSAEERIQSSPCTLSKDWFSRFSVSYEMISSIHFADTLKDAPANALDVSEAGNGKVLAWLSENGGKKDLHIGAEGGVYAPSDCHYLFAWFTNAKAIHFNDAFHTTGVTSMRSMFQGCSTLTELDVSHFDTSMVTDMSAMFCTCSKLTTLDVSNFDTSRVSRMDYMFCECTSPLKLDLSSWDVSNVGSMYQMFFKFSWIGSVDLTGWDVSNVGNYDLFMENGRTIDGQPWEKLFQQ